MSEKAPGLKARAVMKDLYGKALPPGMFGPGGGGAKKEVEFKK